MTDAQLKSRGSLDRELTLLRDSILRISHIVDNALERAVQALKDQDIEVARQVIADDEKVNRLRYQIESDCYRLLSTQQPTARDLRSIITAMHIVVELERIGDHAAAISRLTLELAKEAQLKPLIDIPRMAQIGREMMRQSLNTYIDWDEEQAEQITERDHEIDLLHEQAFRDLMMFMLQDNRNITRATYLVSVSHHLQRVGDRVKNICEHVNFMVTGEFKYN